MWRERVAPFFRVFSFRSCSLVSLFDQSVVNSSLMSGIVRRSLLSDSSQNVPSWLGRTQSHIALELENAGSFGVQNSLMGKKRLSPRAVARDDIPHVSKSYLRRFTRCGLTDPSWNKPATMAARQMMNTAIDLKASPTKAAEKAARPRKIVFSFFRALKCASLRGNEISHAKPHRPTDTGSRRNSWRIDSDKRCQLSIASSVRLATCLVRSIRFSSASI